MSRRGPKEHAVHTDPKDRGLLGLVRRVTVSLTSSVLWRVLGHTLEPGGRRESPDVEPFTGIGYYSRPPASGKPEGIVLSAGGADHPVLVALRDEKTRAAVAAVLGIEADETVVFNSLCALYLKADGTAELRTLGGTAVALALKSDVQEVIDKYNGHIHADPASGVTGPPANPPAAATPRVAANAVGTTTFKTH